MKITHEDVLKSQRVQQLPGYIISLTSFPPIPLAIEILRDVNLYLTHACLASAETKGIIPSTVTIERAGIIISLAAGGPSKKMVSRQYGKEIRMRVRNINLWIYEKIKFDQ